MNRYLVKSNTYLPSKRENLPIHRELGLNVTLMVGSLWMPGGQ
jgi:hypothetical protein